jgi:hypothetical protein
MWKRRFRTAGRWLGSKYPWGCVVTGVVCATLTFDHSWRAALALGTVLLVCISALHEEVHDEPP